MKPEFKKQALAHLKKAEGMLKKVIEMVEGDAYCMDIMQQSLAAQGFMKSAYKIIFENHLNTCFKAGMESKNNKRKQELIAEMIRILNKI
ncbi:metal-sensitive transcriptional regulator [Candidatus Peregrinibacteria bacterium]|nr:metal-sensitive transcriptional regulator [Candidatus Peregrinibacteria bacterium]